MIDALPLLLGPEGYQISRSVRLRSSASAYFNRTFTTPTNNRIFTWSGWVKRGLLGANISYPNFFGTGSDELLIYSATYIDQFAVNMAAGAACNIITTQVFRDPSAWYHIIVAVDTTQATASNRVKIYVNGVQITAFAAATYPSLNYNPSFNSATAHALGNNAGAGRPFDGYLTEINFIDGQALTPSSFGETNAVTGVWQPKKYAGTYGTNGFYLNFSDNSAATAAAIGKDNSGNGNNWTPNNISVTAGVTYDSMLDVPTQWADGGNGRGNYATLNPLWALDSAGNTYSSGNLNLSTNGSSSSGNARCTIALPSIGKFYCEMKPTNFVCSTSGTSVGYYGILATSAAKQIAIRTISSASSSLTGSAIFKDGVSQATITTLSLNDVLGFAIDCGADTVQIFVNNVSVYSGNYSVTSEPYFFGFSGDAGTADRDSATEFNFGQRPFAYTPPTGFKALNTLNLPTPTILKGNQYFDATTYSGQNTALSVTNSGSMQPDLVWIKKRNGATDHNLTDAVRGTNRNLISNSTAAEDTVARLTSFNSNGFTLAGAFDNTNISGSTYVGWQWKEGATQGFDIVTYTGDGTSPRNIAHSLGVAPAMVIVKSRSAVASWMVKHKNLSSNNNLFLEGTNAQLSPGNGYIQDLNNSSTFGVVNGGGGVANINANGTTYVAYLFSEVAGFSKFGSYTGNGSADGPFVFTGFRPRFVLTKRTDSTGDWQLMDTSRDNYNVASRALFPNLSSAEATGYSRDILSNGFKLRDSGASLNASGGTYIFAAFAEHPFKNALAR